MKDLLTIQEVAEITRLHEMTIRRYIQAGKLKALRLGRQIRVPKESLAEFMEPVQTVAEAPPPARKRKLNRDRYLSPDDPIFEIVDLGEASSTDISSDKYRYFAEVLAAKP